MSQIRYRLDENVAYYHLMSRTVNGEAWFGGVEREVLRKMIWQVSAFSGVRLITYAVMKNHFHLLVEVPPRATEVSDRELVRRFRVLYPRPTPWQPMGWRSLRRHLRENTKEGVEMRDRLLERMHDPSWLMRTIKQRFARWFNATKDRFGPVWSERFKSVLVEGDHWALKTVAAYIDLNAVRAGLVDDPKDYRFCGYAEALAGNSDARAGLRLVAKDLADYRQILFGAGSGAKAEKFSISREDALRVLEKERGKLPIPVLLRCRMRYFSDGKILGSEKFVSENVGKASLDSPPKVPPAHRMEGGDWNGLSVAQGLRKKLFS